MKKTRLAYMVGFLLTGLILTCSNEPKPSESEIEQALTERLPAFARVSSFSIDAIQNMGTKVEPLWHARFRATVKVASATFTGDGSDPGVTFVRMVKSEGDSTELFGKSASTLYAGAWRTSLEFEVQPIEALGLPETAFGPGKVIVRGSKEESAYVSEQAEKRRLAGIAAQRQAQEQRLIDERANEEKRQMLANAKQLLVGSWRDQNSLDSYVGDGTFTGRSDSGDKYRGTWAIEGDILTTTTLERNGQPTTFSHQHQIVELTRERFKQRSSDGKIWDAVRVK